MRIRRAGTKAAESILDRQDDWFHGADHLMPIHVHPTAELAPRALLPGDPGRALALAQVLLDEPRMFNHNRGLWGYTGPAKADGAPLTIQSTGMGGPSAAIVVHELIELGLQTAIRVGTCGALVESLALGDLVVACEALAQDGTSRALGAEGRPAADPGLTAALAAAAGVRSEPIVTHDVFYDPVDRIAEWTAEGAVAVEMEAATVFTVCAAQGVRAGCLLAVSDTLVGGRERVDHEGLVAIGERLGTVAVEALAR
jgi:DeoD family purine-nucleoside phosphorylase